MSGERDVHDVPPALRGPVEVALSRPQDTIPVPSEFAGGCAYELKWDGFRLPAVRHAYGTTLWSRRGTDLTRRFPDIADALSRQVPPGVVLDGEVVAWNGERLDFDLLSRRLVTPPADVHALAARRPASYVAFDLLALRGEDLRPRPWADRRALLEDLASTWRPPLQLTPATYDLGRATAWFTELRPAGIEGLVVKPLRSRYAAGRRTWVKVKSRETTELILAGVLGPAEQPEILVLGRYDEGRLAMVARSVPLRDAEAASLARLLRSGGAGHPWPEYVRGGRFGQPGERLLLTRVELLVVEVAADVATYAGALRHPVRFLRARPDLAPLDLQQHA